MEDVRDGTAAFVRGGFTLFAGSFVSLFVMAAGSILVARMMSPSDYGLYGVSLVLPSLFLMFSDWGVDAALTRFLAKYRAEGNHGMIRRLEKGALLFKLGLGGVLTLALYLSADFLAAALLKRPEAGGFVRLSSGLVLFQALYATVVSGLAGLERMNLRASVNIIQAMVKGVSSPLLVYYGFGISGAVIGHLSVFAVASILGGFLMIRSSSGLEGDIEAQMDAMSALGLMLGFGRPLFVGGLVAGMALRFQGFLLSWFVSDTAFGNYHVALNFTMLIGLVTGSLAVTLFPAFSRLSYVLEPEKAREAFRGSVRYSSMFVIPMICLLVAVSEPMVVFLFTTRYTQVPLMLLLLLVPTLLVGMGSLSLGGFLNSQGDTKLNLRVRLVGSAISILVSPVLVWMWGIFGLAVSLIISSSISRVFGLYVLKKRYGFYPDLRHSGRTLLSSVFSAGLSFGGVRFFSSVAPFLSLVIGSVIFVVVYLILAPSIGALEEEDIVNLDSMMSGLGVLYPFIRVFLRVERKIIRFIMGSREGYRSLFNR